MRAIKRCTAYPAFFDAQQGVALLDAATQHQAQQARTEQAQQLQHAQQAQLQQQVQDAQQAQLHAQHQALVSSLLAAAQVGVPQPAWQAQQAQLMAQLQSIGISAAAAGLGLPLGAGAGMAQLPAALQQQQQQQQAGTGPLGTLQAQLAAVQADPLLAGVQLQLPMGGTWEGLQRQVRPRGLAGAPGGAEARRSPAAGPGCLPRRGVSA